MFDDLTFFDTYVEKIPIGMKRKYVFYELPHWEHLNIGHLLDPMHILKIVSYSLWRHISSSKSGILAVRRDIIASNTKRDIGQENKLEERLVLLGILNKVMSHGILRKMIFVRRRMLYWV
jgi:hypothetical protein